MKIPEKRVLFSMKEITNACGVSRSTLLRMEEDGFLKPYKIDPESGYRYYDLQNVAAVGQYQRGCRRSVCRENRSPICTTSARTAPRSWKNCGKN